MQGKKLSHRQSSRRLEHGLAADLNFHPYSDTPAYREDFCTSNPSRIL